MINTTKIDLNTKSRPNHDQLIWQSNGQQSNKNTEGHYKAVLGHFIKFVFKVMLRSFYVILTIMI